jgi:hypothetical protein
MRETVTLAGQGVLNADYVNPQWVRLLDLLQMNPNVIMSLGSLCWIKGRGAYTWQS